MNPLPSSSHGTMFQFHDNRKFVVRKTYVPNLFTSRPPKVEAKANEEVEKMASFSATRSEYFRNVVLLRGADTLAAFLNAVDSDVTKKNEPQTDDSTSNRYLNSTRAEVDGDKSFNEGVATKSNISKFARVSSASLSDLPISIPRLLNDTSELASLLMENLDSPVDKSVKFVLKTPQFLPTMCAMHELPDGRMGTLQIMKSNRLRLVLGECKFWLHRGIKVDFREEVAYVNVDAETKTGQIVNLGNISERILAVPEFVTVFFE